MDFPIKKTNPIKKVLFFVLGLIAAFVIIDLAILATAILQIIFENRTGEWSEWWAWQARLLFGL